MKSLFKKASNVIKTWHYRNNLPLRLEFILTDFCNLNCKGCTHYSPVAPEEYMHIEELRHDANYLGKVCPDMPMVYLIGGETLLYPEINEAMDIMRESFPKAQIKLFTNGILIPKMNNDFWKKVRKNNVILSITRYPVNFDYNTIEEICRNNGAEYEIFGDRGVDNTFFRFPLDPEGKQNPRVSHFKCFNYGCISVKKGKIYPCSISACIENLNKSFGTEFQHQPKDFINVKDVTSLADVLRLRNNPVPFCRYCKAHYDVVKYGPSRREQSEWVD